MSDPTGREASGPTQPIGYSYPAYADQVSYQPTQQFPSGRSDYSPFLEPNGPKRPTPRWLWVLAGLSVLLVLGLVIALVIINSNEQQTLVAPPPIPEPTRETTTTPSTPTLSASPTPIPLPIPLPLPGLTTPPSDVTPPGEGASPGTSETVVYSVTGTGRAINITYIDNGNVLQTEFNVMLPWSKEVQLAPTSARSASVSVVNVGRPVSCAISIDGTPVQQHTGMGLTVCSAMQRMGRS